MEKIIIYGSKDFAQNLRNLVGICGHTFIGFIDDFEPNKESVLGTFKDLISKYSPEEYKIINGLGYNNLKARWDLQIKLNKHQYKTINLIHPQAIVDNNSYIGSGNIIMAGAIVEMNSRLNDLVVMWPGAILNHDSEIGNNCFLSPGSNICGFVKVQENCFIGASAVVVNNLIVPANTFIKAGSLYSNQIKVDKQS